MENVKNLLSILVHAIRALGSTALNIMQLARGGEDCFSYRNAYMGSCSGYG